jgi:muramidase (phage lysozyme)
MNVANTLGIAVLGAMLGLGTSGCSASSSDDTSANNVENVDSTSEELSGGSCTASLANGAVAAKHRALLDTIAFTEGTRNHGQNGYNVTFAYHYFSSCARHPNLRICSGGYCSTAAGRYQFLTATWNGLGLGNFGPANQDRGGMKLVSRRGANVPTGRAMTATEFANTMNRISYEWASLPPGRYGQPSYSMAATRRQYCAFARC